MQYWLMKSEPTEYSIDALKKDHSSSWFGVRNYQARNFMRDNMSVGDMVLFYHSSCPNPGVYGFAKVASAPHPDATQYVPGKHFDPKSTVEKPIWVCVDVEFVAKLDQPYLLSEIRENPILAGMKILSRGNRLSITPVTEEEFRVICPGNLNNPS